MQLRENPCMSAGGQIRDNPDHPSRTPDRCPCVHWRTTPQLALASLARPGVPSMYRSELSTHLLAAGLETTPVPEEQSRDEGCPSCSWPCRPGWTIKDQRTQVSQGQTTQKRLALISTFG